jgi:hypothetical protein
MPAWLSALLVALWELIKPWLMPTAAAAVGSELQKGKQAQDTLKGVQDAAKASADNRRLPYDERVQFLERRGRVRGLRK